MTRGLLRAMCALGRRSGRGAGVGGLTHRWGVASAALLAIVAGWLFIGAHSVFNARDDRIWSREPVHLFSDTSARPIAHWLDRGDHFQDRQFITILIAQIDPAASPPPGLPRWPQAGEAFFSPALVAADDAGVLRQRYGRFGGVIGMPGLAEPGEWLVYLRPPHDEDFSRYPESLITRIGSAPGPDRVPLTAGLSGRTYLDFYLLLLLVTAAPVLLLIMIAVRSGAEVRDRRLAMLDALGAPRRAKAWVLVGESALPVTIGAGIAGLGALATTYVDTTLPVVNYQLLATDLASARWAIVPLLVGCVGMMFAALVGAQLRRRSERATRPRLVSGRLRRWPALVCGVAIAACLWSANEAAARGGVSESDTLAAIFTISFFITILTVPALVAVVTALLGHLVGQLGRRMGLVSMLVSGRWLAGKSAGIVRLSAAVVVGLGLLTLVQVWLSQDAQAGQWLGVRRHIGQELLTVRTAATHDIADRFTSTIGTQRVLWVGEDKDGHSLLVGDCTALAVLGTVDQCPSVPTLASAVYGKMTAIGTAVQRENATILIGREPMLSTTRPDQFQNVGFLVANPDGASGAERVTRTAFAMLPIPDVSDPGQYEVGGRAVRAEVYRWLGVFGGGGILILLLSTALGAVDILLNQARTLGPIGAMHGRRRLYSAISAWHIGLPLVVAGTSGVLIGAALGQQYVRLTGSGVVSWRFLATGFGSVLAITVVLTCLCSVAITRSVRRWSPVAD